jgi:nuclear mRNA export protein SAC3
VHGALGGAYPFDWRLWLSMNPENDGTAIWVERKFDVPSSGRWASKRVFSIPLNPEEEQSSSPGLIVFECVPLEGVSDDIEMYVSLLRLRRDEPYWCHHANSKYRALDDCARLRDIVASLPEDRHFVPSMLFIVWGEGGQAVIPDELLKMVRFEHVFLDCRKLTTSAGEDDCIWGSRHI